MSNGNGVEMTNVDVTRARMVSVTVEREPAKKPAVDRAVDSFFWTALTFQFAMFLCWLFGAEYDEVALASAAPDPDASINYYYPMFQDIHIMMFIGFGFLMTFERRYGFGAVGFNYLLASMALQWGILTTEFFHKAWRDFSEPIKLNVGLLINGDFAAATILISMGGVLGKVTSVQLVWMIIFELILYAVNFEIVTTSLKAMDIGGSITIHTFGAYFGLAVSYIVTPKDMSEKNRDADNKSVYHSDLFSMIGTIFLWCYWPSFNGGLGLNDFNSRHRVVINTVLSLSAACISTFTWSRLWRKTGKFEMVDIQNATLAGGVAVGASADMMLRPWGAILLGFSAGMLSSFGFARLQSILWEKLKLHDSCGIHNLHGMPGLLGGIASGIAAAAIQDSHYGNTPGAEKFYPGRVNGESAIHQGGLQVAATFVAFGIAIAGGLVVGLLLKSPLFRQPKLLFNDQEEWEAPHEETPYFHDRHSVAH